MVDLTPVDYLSGLGGLQNLPNPARDMQIAQGLRTTQLQQQAAQLGLQQAMQQQERQNRFYSDIEALGNDPSPLGIASMIRKYPEFANELKQSHEIQDEAKRESDFRVQSQVYSAAANGRYDLAADILQQYNDAATRAGEPPDETDQAIITALRSGDRAEQNRALSMIGLAVASINPKKFAETYKALGQGGESYTLAPGSRRFGPNNELVAEAPFAPQYRTVGPEQSLVEVGGTSGGTPAGNSPEAALSTRLNNPGAIRFDPDNKWQGQVGQEGGFVRFDSAASGKRAHQKLISNQIKAGFDTPLTWAQRYAPAEDGNDPAAYAQTVADGLGIGVNDKIPLSAVPKMAAISARVEAGGSPASGGGARVIAQGGGKPGYEMLSPEEVSQLGLDPQVRYQRGPNGQVTVVGGQDIRTRGGRPLPQGAIDKLTPRVEARDNLGRALSTFQDDYGGNTFTGSAENWLQAAFGTGTPGQRDWWSAFYDTDNLIRNQLFGSALTDTEKKAYEQTTITPRMDPKTIRQNLTRRNEIIRKALDRQKRVLIANKYDKDAIEELFAGDPLDRATASGFKILGVRPK